MRFLVNVLAAFGKQAAEASDIDITDLLVAVAFNYQAVQGVRAKALVRVATLPASGLPSQFARGRIGGRAHIFSHCLVFRCIVSFYKGRPL